MLFFIMFVMFVIALGLVMFIKPAPATAPAELKFPPMHHRWKRPWEETDFTIPVETRGTWAKRTGMYTSKSFEGTLGEYAQTIIASEWDVGGCYSKFKPL